MTIAWMAYLLLVGTLLALAAVASEGILRRTKLGTRWVWIAALAGTVIASVVAPRAAPSSAASIEVLVSAEGHTVTLSPPTPWNRLLGDVRSTITLIARKAMTEASRPPIRFVLVGSWAAASSVLVLLLIGMNWRVQRQRKDWPVVEVAGTRVRVSPAMGPAVIGVAPPEIIVPHWLLARSVEDQHLVIMHERAHVVAHDHVLPIAAWAVAALLPWHPAVWFALSRLRLAIELDCDARVLRQGVKARSYGALLIDIAGECAGRRIGALALADKTTHLERRLLAMQYTTPRFSRIRTGALAAITTLSIVIACQAKLPTSANVDKTDATSMIHAARQAKIADVQAARIHAAMQARIKHVQATMIHAAMQARIDHIQAAQSTNHTVDGKVTSR